MDAILNRNDKVIRSAFELPDGVLSGLHFGPMEQPVKLIFLHANGFNGLSYHSILDELGVHVLSLDLRGHGHTTLPAKADSFATFHTYAQDVIEVIRNHIGHTVILAGHSLGASTAILAAGLAPDLVRKVLALDAIVLPAYVRAMMAFGPSRRYLQRNYPMAKAAGKRRADFDSFETAFKRYKGKGTFKHFPDAAVWDYVCGGFLKTDTGITLACRPQWEQFTYSAQSHDLKKAIRKLSKGSRLILTDFVPQNPKWMQKAMRKNPGIIIEHHPEMNHFYPLINPEISIPALRDILTPSN